MIYYNNGKVASPSNCRSKLIDVTNAYFPHTTDDKFFVNDVYVEDSHFIPETVSLIGISKDNYFPDGYSPEIERARIGRSTQLERIYITADNSYKVTMTITARKTGEIKFSPYYTTYDYDKSFYNESRVSNESSFSIKASEGKTYTFTVFFHSPQKQHLVYRPNGERDAYNLVNATVENISLPSTIVGNPVDGATRIRDGRYQIYLNGKWKNVRME